jgi:hypothetical protein
MPFGFDSPEFQERLAAIARSIDIWPKEVWTVAGSGTLCRALMAAWPLAAFHAVQVGKLPRCMGARVLLAPEPFERDAMVKPPFPSCSNYDAKAWRFVSRLASPGALFWNVAA